MSGGKRLVLVGVIAFFAGVFVTSSLLSFPTQNMDTTGMVTTPQYAPQTNDKSAAQRCEPCAPASNVEKQQGSTSTKTPNRCGPLDENIQAFREVAMSVKPVTDKVTSHSYHIMYGTFLSGVKHQPIKMMEIGLGCGMVYGPGASVQVWKKYLHPDSEIWMAEQNAACVEKHKEAESMKGIKVVTGDQANRTTLERWVQETGGGFDVIVDDGGHTNLEIKHTFDVFWPQLKPGGLYFIEDLLLSRMISRRVSQDRLEDGRTMADVIKSWVEALMIPPRRGGFNGPAGLQSVFCQREACAFLKAPSVK